MDLDDTALSEISPDEKDKCQRTNSLICEILNNKNKKELIEADNRSVVSRGDKGEGGQNR